MEFLKEIFGDEIYNQVKEKLDAYNGDEANKDKQIKLGNLASGEYVGKGKFDALNELLTGKQTELDTANNLINQLKKDTKGNEDLQEKITGYETQLAELNAKYIETKLNSAIKLALVTEKALDVDYLTYKLKEILKDNNKTLELDDNDNIKGWNDYLTELKTKFPTQFDNTSTGKKIIENRLPEGNKDDNNVPASLDDALKQHYEQKG